MEPKIEFIKGIHLLYSEFGKTFFCTFREIAFFDDGSVILYESDNKTTEIDEISELLDGNFTKNVELYAWVDRFKRTALKLFQNWGHLTIWCKLDFDGDSLTAKFIGAKDLAAKKVYDKTIVVILR